MAQAALPMRLMVWGRVLIRAVTSAGEYLFLGPTTGSSFPNYWLGAPRKPSPLAETQKNAGTHEGFRHLKSW